MKLVNYTVMFTDDPNKLHGDLVPYTHDKEGVDYIAFTNSPHVKSDFWDVRLIDDMEKDGSHEKFRLFLSSDPAKAIPISILDRSIKITNEPYPQILITREILKDGSKYYGPFTDVNRLRAMMNMLTKIFPIRSCTYRIDQKAIKDKKISL